MKHAIISDVHANPQALESALADAERYGMFGATRDHEPRPCMSIACGECTLSQAAKLRVRCAARSWSREAQDAYMLIYARNTDVGYRFLV